MPRVLVQAHFLAEHFAVKPPALAEGRGVAKAAKVRQRQLLLCQADLKVVPGYGFMQKKHCGGEACAGVGLVGVVVKNTGARAIRHAGVILCRRAVHFTECLNGTNLKRGLGHAGEQGRDLVVDAGAKVFISDLNVLTSGKTQFGCAVHVVEKFLERALESHTFACRFKLLANAGHLAHAQRMHRLRAQVGGGGTFGKVRVPGGAVGQGTHAHRVARRRQVRVAQEAVQALLGRHDALAHQGTKGGCEPCFVGFGEAGRKRLHRTHVDVFIQVRRGHVVELGQHRFDQCLGQDHACAHAFSHVQDHAVHGGCKTSRTGQPVVIVFHGGKRLGRSARAQLRERQWQAGHLVDRCDVLGELKRIE